MASVLCISGLDPSGHAGISTDLRVMDFLGVRCYPVVSALTVQNDRSFTEIQPVPVAIIQRQLDAIFEMGRPGAVKLGILGSSEIAVAVSEYLDGRGVPVITDPILVSSTGFNLMDRDIMKTYLGEIFPITDLLTPNAPEACAITGIRVDGPDDAREACRMIGDMGPKSVLLKGGHFKTSRGTDVYYDGSDFELLPSSEVYADARGTGCAYSSLIAGHVSLGMEMPAAARKAKQCMTEALERHSVKNDGVLRFHPGVAGR